MLLRATAVCLVLAAEASAFSPAAAPQFSVSRSVTAVRGPSVACSAEAGRRELLQRAAAFGGAVLLKGPAAFAADDDDGNVRVYESPDHTGAAAHNSLPGMVIALATVVGAGM